MAKQKTEIVLFSDREETMKTLKNEILRNAGTNEDFVKYAEIQKINNKAEFDAVSDGLKTGKKYINSVKNSRLEITRQIDSFKSELMDFEKELAEPAQKIIDHLDPILRDWTEAEEREAQRLYLERAKRLTDAGFEPIGGLFVCGIFQLTAESLASLSDEDLQSYINKGIEETERKKKEKEAQEAQAKLLDEQAREIRELKERLALKETELNERETEVKTQEEALEKRYEEPVIKEPSVTAPSLEFDLPPALPVIEKTETPPVKTEPAIDPVSYNQGLQDAHTAMNEASGLTKAKYMELILSLKK